MLNESYKKVVQDEILAVSWRKSINSAKEAKDALEAALPAYGYFDIRVDMPRALKNREGETTIYAANVSFKWELNGHEKPVESIVCGFVYHRSNDMWYFVNYLPTEILNAD